jgi:hypothetical protein
MSSQLSGTSGPASGSPATPASGPATPAPPRSSASPTGATSAPGAPSRDWPAEVADRVESVVGTVRDKTTVPITKVARAVVFGLLAAVVAVIALVFAIDAVVRIIDVYLPFGPYGRRVWVGYAGLGAIFFVAGVFCWSKRTRKPQETHS